MKKRTVTGAAITAAVYIILCYSHLPVVLTTAVTVLNILVVFELFQSAGIEHNLRFLCLAVVAAVMISLMPMKNYAGYLPYLFAIAALLSVLLMRKVGNCPLDTPVQITGICLVIVFLFRSIQELRQLEYGLYYLTFAVTVCFVTDALAYLVGKTAGKRKLCPAVSPNKTIEGSLGGMAGAVCVLMLLGWALQKKAVISVDFPMLTVYVVTASAVAQFGDLALSAVKRCLGVKDFGNLLPGHGGVLDRFDSHLFCIAYTLLFCTLTSGYFR